jgi:hypothetical protein
LKNENEKDLMQNERPKHRIGMQVLEEYIDYLCNSEMGKNFLLMTLQEKK